MADTVTDLQSYNKTTNELQLIVVQSDGTGGTTVFGDVSALTSDDDGTTAHLSPKNKWSCLMAMVDALHV